MVKLKRRPIMQIRLHFRNTKDYYYSIISFYSILQVNLIHKVHIPYTYTIFLLFQINKINLTVTLLKFN